MRHMRTTDTDPAPGLGELPFHILLALGDGPSHGYAIGQRVEEESGGRLDPTTGALYQALRRLTEEGLVTPVATPDEVDPRRKYFAITRLWHWHIFIFQCFRSSILMHTHSFHDLSFGDVYKYTGKQVDTWSHVYLSMCVPVYFSKNRIHQVALAQHATFPVIN